MIDTAPQNSEHNPSAHTGGDVTHIPQPSRRAFLKLSFREKLAGLMWTVVRHSMFRFSPPPLHRWRVLLLNIFGASVHRTVRIAPSARVDFPWNFTADAHVTIMHQVIINCMGRVTIGEGTRVSQYAHICAGTHDYQRRDMAIVRSPITIGKDVWIAADAFVGPGVTLGDHCMLAARSSAFGDLPCGQICIGEPAVPRKDRFEHEGEYAAVQLAASQQ